jgi:hypothetical protein
VKYRTVAAWLRVPDAAREAVRGEGVDYRAGLHAATHALINVLPLYLMASQADVVGLLIRDTNHVPLTPNLKPKTLDPKPHTLNLPLLCVISQMTNCRVGNQHLATL